MAEGKTALERYPEFKGLVDKLTREIVTKINDEAPEIVSEMPYKRQMVLECVIEKLNELV